MCSTVSRAERVWEIQVMIKVYICSYLCTLVD